MSFSSSKPKKAKSEWSTNGEEFLGVVRIATPDGRGFDEDMADEIHKHFDYYSVRRQKGDNPYYINNVSMPDTIYNSIIKIKNTSGSDPGIKTAVHCALVWSVDSLYEHVPIRRLRRLRRWFNRIDQTALPIESYITKIYEVKTPHRFEAGQKSFKTIPVMSEDLRNKVWGMKEDIGTTESTIVNMCLLFYLKRQEKVAETYRESFKRQLDEFYEVMEAKADVCATLNRKLINRAKENGLVLNGCDFDDTCEDGI